MAEVTTYRTFNSCLLCNSTSLKKLPVFSKDYLVKCNACSFVFSARVPTNEELIAHYDGYGRADYLSPITVQRYHELLDSFEPFRKNNRLLDVGCGIGYFLEVAKERGWEVYGTEYTDEAVRICKEKGISMQQGKLDPKQYELESFDIITSFEVLEHINNPQEELVNFYQLVRSGGAVYITTPNFNSLLRYRLQEKYDVICYPEHLTYYTPKTLKNIFLASGFKKEFIQTTGISLTRLRRGKGVHQQAVISAHSDDERLRVEIEQKKYLKVVKNLINKTLTILGVGDSLKGFFMKK